MPYQGNDTTTVHRNPHNPCPQPGRECAYDRDHSRIDKALTGIQKGMAEMKTAHEVDMATIEGHMKVGNQRFLVLERSVFGFIGLCFLIGIGIVAAKIFGA